LTEEKADIQSSGRSQINCNQPEKNVRVRIWQA